MRKRLPVCVPTVQFLIPVNGVWGTLAELHASPPLLLDHYLNRRTNPEEVCAGAVWVFADGKPWNSPEASETFLHIGYWLTAIASLLKGEVSVSIWAWEETGMRATRDNGFVILEDRTHHVDFQLPPVGFDLKRFAGALLDATKAGVELELELMRLAEERYPTEWRAIVAAAERSKAGLPEPPPDRPADPVMDDLSRRLWSASGRKLLRLAKEFEREEERRRKADPEGFAKQERAAHLEDILNSVHGGEMSAAWQELSAAIDTQA
jgi:hypothetical protein